MSLGTELFITVVLLALCFLAAHLFEKRARATKYPKTEAPKETVRSPSPPKAPWQQKIDRWHEAQEAEEKRLRKLEEERSRELERQCKAHLLAEHCAKFRCHICGLPSSGPEYVYYENTANQMAIEHNRGSSHWEAKWDIPESLYQCEICKQWTCEKHIYNGICQKCAEKL